MPGCWNAGRKKVSRKAAENRRENADTEDGGLRTEYRIQESEDKRKKEARMQKTGDRMKRKPAKSFEDLIVWQKAHQFVLGVYKLTEKFPKTEIYGLTSQFRRAAISIPANTLPC